jgi:Concanavalin A-like lectin/glucanases superfamily/F5/8 type C domain
MRYNTVLLKVIAATVVLTFSGVAFNATAQDKLTLKVVKVDSEETAGEDGKGANAVDGDTNTIWHTQWQDSNPAHPHEIIIELSRSCLISGFTYLPRQDEMENGSIKDYEFYISEDGKDFGQPVTKGTFENSKEKKTATFAPKQCRFVKLKAVSEVNGEAWASAAEIGIIEDDGKSASKEATGMVSPAALTHRYSFTTDASDSVGHADGTLQGNATITDGQVRLNGVRGTYVNLPGGLIAGYSAVTFEFWATLGTNNSWPRVFDQGSTNGDRGGHDLYFCPHSGLKDFRLTIMDPHPTERVVTVSGDLDNQTNLHVACVLDPASGFMGVYTNGVLASSRKDLVSLSSVDTNLFFLGRSLFASDAPLNGSIDEFRIYNAALSASAIAMSHANGPNVVFSAGSPARN